MIRTTIVLGSLFLAALGCDSPSADRARTNTGTPHTTNKPVEDGTGTPSGANQGTPTETAPSGTPSQPGAGNPSGPTP